MDHDRTPGSARTATNSYQMSLGVEQGDRDVIEESVAQVSAWLRGRRRSWDPDLRSNGFQFERSPKRDLLTLHHESAQGREFRVRLTEDTTQGLWRTQLTVSLPRSASPWLSLHVGNSEGRWAAVPGLATRLLDTLSTRDGLSVVSSKATTITPNNVEDFLEELTEPDRRGLYLVAATDRAGESGAFADRAQRWMKEIRGLAQLAVLTPEATTIANEALGESHAVAPWTVRTFYPEVDPAIRADGFRHKWLSPDRLARGSDHEIQQLLGRIARRHAYLRPSLDGYTTVDRGLRRLEDQTLVQSIASLVEPDVSLTRPSPGTEPSPAAGETLSRTTPASAPTPSPVRSREGDAIRHEPVREELHREVQRELAEQTRLLGEVKRILDLPELTIENLQTVATKAAQAESVSGNMRLFDEQLEQRDAREGDLEARVESLQQAFDDAQLDSRIAGDDAAKLRDENRYLKKQLATYHDAAAYAAIPAEAYTRYPDSFEELWERRSEFEAAGVMYTGSQMAMLDLDEHDTLGNAVHAAWDGFLALADNLRARKSKDCDANLREYLRETPAGYRSMPSNKFGGKETRATMERWGAQRVFPVPREVDATGAIVMEAHFKLASIGMVSPRMYFLHCYSTDGNVYVGYIGAHLTNTMS